MLNYKINKNIKWKQGSSHVTFGLLLLPHVIKTGENTDMYVLYMLVRSWIGETCCRNVYMKRLTVSGWTGGILIIMTFDQYLQGNTVFLGLFTQISEIRLTSVVFRGSVYCLRTLKHCDCETLVISQ